MICSKFYSQQFSMLGLLILVGCILSTESFAQERITSKQRQQIRKIGSTIDRAGRMFQNEKLGESAKLIQQVQREFDVLTKDAPTSLIDELRGPYQRLQTAHRLLLENEQKMPALKPLPAGVTKSGEVTVSFVGEVASILNAKCGNCHVRRNRGNFSLANFRALMNGLGGSPVVVPEKPDESYLIEIIDSGEMPQGGGEVTEMEIEKLKKWISQGAKFDGQSADANLAEIARAANRQSQPRVVRASGNETVSFAKDLAPVIVSNCNGCHFEPQNIRGGLNLTSFRQLLRGGDSGTTVMPGSADESLIIQHLTASDGKRQMPPRRALAGPIIEKFKTWIDEGARFDGRADNMNLRELAEIAKAESSTHEELAVERRTGALDNWRKVMSDAKPNEISSKEFLVLGLNSDQLKRALSFAESTAPKIKSELKIRQDDPLVKGQISLFVFDRRYDYSEFGKMVEGRDLPKSWLSHWGFDTVSAYCVMKLDSQTGDLAKIEPQLTQQIAAVTVASLGSGIPKWFSNGMGYVIAEKVVADKSVVKRWQDKSATLTSQLPEPMAFLRNSLPEEQSALVAYGFVKMLMQNGRQFKGFLSDLRKGTSFQDAFQATYAVTPEELAKQMSSNQRRNRRGR